MGDGVFHLGSSYIAIADSTGEAPGTGASWGLLAQRGSDGRNGEPGLSWQGPWDDQREEYVLGDAVEHNGSSWIFIGSGRVGEPGVDFSDWQLVAQKGDPGPSGAPPAPNQAVIGTIVLDGITTAELPVLGLEFDTVATGPTGGGTFGHTLRINRQVDRWSPQIMRALLMPGPDDPLDVTFKLKSATATDPYLSYEALSGSVTSVRQVAGNPNLETLVFGLESPEDEDGPTITVGHPSTKPPGAGMVVGRLTLDSVQYDLLEVDWQYPALDRPPLEIVRRHGGSTNVLFADFL
ncbi:MAG: hypothetical protein WD805_01840, partial [Gaiellaceae bacterium]